MKRILLLSILCALFSTFTYAQQYGTPFSTEHVMDVPDFVNSMKSMDKADNIVVTGTITEVCQKAGCWVKLENEEGDDIFVKFKETDGNHELVIPKDFAGKTAIVHGKASKKTISVKDQKHYAEDAGDSEEEIAKITKPKQELRIDATGVVIN